LQNARRHSCFFQNKKAKSETREESDDQILWRSLHCLFDISFSFSFVRELKSGKVLSVFGFLLSDMRQNGHLMGKKRLQLEEYRQSTWSEQPATDS
jgi:hypothetical protein